MTQTRLSFSYVLIHSSVYMWYKTDCHSRIGSEWPWVNSIFFFIYFLWQRREGSIQTQTINLNSFTLITYYTYFVMMQFSRGGILFSSCLWPSVVLGLGRPLLVSGTLLQNVLYTYHHTIYILFTVYCTTSCQQIVLQLQIPNIGHDTNTGWLSTCS